MLNLALKAVQSALTSIEIGGTPLIEKYGGLVFPIAIPQEVGKTDGGESILKQKVFPVACGVTFQDCVTNRKYQQLVPDSKYKSLVYWEQLGDATLNATLSQFAPKGGLLVYDIPARLVAWLNIAKLNVNGDGDADCSIVAPVALKIQTALYRKNGFTVPNEAYQGARVQLIFNGQEKKDAANVFGRYTYGNEVARFMLYPYDFFSLRYTIRLSINRNCVEAFTLGTPIDCALGVQSES